MNTIATDYRHYDAALGRFNNMDALSELAYGQTPYRYGFNNPVYWTDPTGLFETAEEARKFASIELGVAQNQFNVIADSVLGGFRLYIISGLFAGTQWHDFSIIGQLEELFIDRREDNTGHRGINGGEDLSTKVDVWAWTSSSADGYGAYLRYKSATQGGSFRLYKSLQEGKKWAPKYYKNNFGVRGTGKHVTYNVSKTIAKGTIVTSALLEVPEIVDGVKADQGIGRNTVTQTAGAVGGVWGGIWLGSKAGAAMSAGTTNPYIIGGAVIVGGFVGGIAGETAAEALIESIPSSNYNPDRPVILHKR